MNARKSLALQEASVVCSPGVQLCWGCGKLSGDFPMFLGWIPHGYPCFWAVVGAIVASSDISKSFFQRAALGGATSEQTPGSAVWLLRGSLVPSPVQGEPRGAPFSGQGALPGASSPSRCALRQTSAGSSLSPSQASWVLAPPGAPPCAARSLPLPAGRGSRQHRCQPSWAQRGSHLLLLVVPTSKSSPVPPTSTTPHLWQLQDAVKHFST